MDHYWCTLSSVIQLSSVAMRLTNCQGCIAHIQNHTAENRWSTMGGLMILETLGAFVDCPHRCLTLGAAIVALPWRSHTVESRCFPLKMQCIITRMYGSKTNDGWINHENAWALLSNSHKRSRSGQVIVVTAYYACRCRNNWTCQKNQG